ncbi:protein containing Por secretion system C-terminal sorting domain [Lentimicrobium saccharophilum]|uniref:Protein containing Por secretion system C-terminal sorting domain n=1 Tax=Lentimicrobium saccharophilum TaxID=1678841 RepID=A0A0S7BZC8_9BACT|nr:T9SS type A sorting domain-containing protein [Lentimicrobium saccharophilum]GAP43041.1 protein containing Por secretion system C-terminal sorting domain [Lentimicrobium saccharophilum]
MKKILIIGIISLLGNVTLAQNSNLSGGVVFDGEPFLAVNPQNPRHMVVAWMGYVFLNRIMIRTRVSTDGGINWSAAANVPHVQNGHTSADPSLAFDIQGNVFLSCIDYDPYFTSGAVYVRKSTDGGLTWEQAAEVIAFDDDPGRFPIDRPWITIDRSGGAFSGNIYITTMNASPAGAPPYHPYFTRSVDQGQSFQAWRYADTTGWLSGPFIAKPMPTPATSSTGIFHCIYPSLVFSQNLLPQFILASSADAGISFTHRSVIAAPSTIAVSDTSAKKGYLLRVNPSDPLHLAFIHLRNESGDADVFLMESVDGGETWNEGIRINDDPAGNGRMQDLVWAAFDTDGDLAIAWRDRRNAADTGYAAAYEIYAAVRLKNEPDFSPNFRLSSEAIPFDEILFQNGNDFMCLELFNDTLSAVWGDTRNGALNIWFQRSHLNGTLLSLTRLTDEKLPPLKVTKINHEQVLIEGDEITGIAFFSIKGAEVLRVKNLPGNSHEIISLRNFPPGTYLIRVQTAHGSITAKMIR